MIKTPGNEDETSWATIILRTVWEAKQENSSKPPPPSHSFLFVNEQSMNAVNEQHTCTFALWCGFAFCISNKEMKISTVHVTLLFLNPALQSASHGANTTYNEKCMWMTARRTLFYNSGQHHTGIAISCKYK